MQQLLGLVPAEVLAAGRDWEDQHRRLRAAAGQVGDAPVGGFTALVEPVARRLAGAWRERLEALSVDADRLGEAVTIAVGHQVAGDDDAAVRLTRLAREVGR